MEIPNWLREAAIKVAKGTKLVPSEQTKLATKKEEFERQRTDIYDAKTALEEQVGHLEVRLKKLDEKRQNQTGALRDATGLEMEALFEEHEETAADLNQSIQTIGELNKMVRSLARLLRGQVIKAEDWDDLAVIMEEALGDQKEAHKARSGVLELEAEGKSGRPAVVDSDHLTQRMHRLRGEPMTPGAGKDRLSERLEQISRSSKPEPDLPE